MVSGDQETLTNDIFIKLRLHCTFAAAGDEVFVVSSKAGVDCVEALGHTLVLPHQHPVLEVPQVHSLDTATGGKNKQQAREEQKQQLQRS